MSSGSGANGAPGAWSLRCKLELAAYCGVVACSFYFVLTRGFALSAEFDSGGQRRGILRRLEPGWLFSRSVDLSDAQWSAFRANMPLLSAAMGMMIASSWLARRFAPGHVRSVHLAYSLAFVGYAHGAKTLFVFGLVMGNYVLAHICKRRRFGPAVTWIYNCTALFLARLHSGFSFSALSPSLAFLDRYGGAHRWHICFNIVVLRCISFAIDLHYASKPPEQQARKPSRDRLKALEQQSLPAPAYSAATYLAYIFYPPLYIGGPIISFNCYAAQLRSGMSPSGRAVAVYAARLALAMLVLEAMTHTLYFNAIAQQRAWKKWPSSSSLSFPVSDIGITGFWVLNFMWLKFLVIWRYFRCCALLEGIEPPENMLRCVNNNYDIEGFWRGWHASFNRWLVRYMYIPLGGSSYRIFNIWAIFTFVALWHDLELRMLGWAWLMCLFFAPELGVKWAIKQPWAESLRSRPWYRHLAGLGATINIAFLMVANLLGFVTGIDGIPDFLRVLGQDRVFLLGVLVTFFAAAQVMFAIRESESERCRRLARVE